MGVRAYAEEIPLPHYSVNAGISLGAKPGQLATFWKDGIDLGVGYLLPPTIEKGYVQFWFNVDYSYFRFDHNSLFPIESFEPDSVIHLNGKDAHIITAIINCRIPLAYLRNPVVPFLSLGYGFIGRSKMNIKSDSPILPSAQTGFKGAGLFAMSIGMGIRIKENSLITAEWKYIIGNTQPGKTSLGPLLIGLEF
jgi:hypothetical protein